jgi:hypothetical protein
MRLFNDGIGGGVWDYDRRLQRGLDRFRGRAEHCVGRVPLVAVLKKLAGKAEVCFGSEADIEMTTADVR